jgi:hypothetical protein
MIRESPACSARALGKDDQGIAGLQRLGQRLQRVFLALALAFHVHRVEDRGGDPLPEA